MPGSRRKTTDKSTSTTIPAVFDREPPKSIEAERAVLGAILLNPESIHTALEIFGYSTENLFYYPPHQIIFNAICEIHQSNLGKPDIKAVVGLLESKNLLTSVGGVSYLSELQTEIPTSGNIEYYATIVLETALTRRLIEQCSKIVGKAYDVQHNIKDLIDLAEAEIFAISAQHKVNPIFKIENIVPEVVNAIRARAQNEENLTGISTGFEILDYYLCGLQRSEMIVLAARPSVGKTAFALNIAKHTAVDQNKGVLIFSLEMAKEQLVQRLICMTGDIDGQAMRKASLMKRKFPDIVKASGFLINSPIYIDDTPNINVMELRSKARQHLLRHPDVELIIIDYLQLMSVPYRGENRQVEIAEISRQIKGLARELNRPIIALCQLSREAEKESAEPRLAHLRESGAIEQDADVVLMLYNEKKDEKDHERGRPKDRVKVFLKIAKQRNGPTGTIELEFIRSRQQFLQITAMDEIEPAYAHPSPSYVDREESPF